MYQTDMISRPSISTPIIVLERSEDSLKLVLALFLLQIARSISSFKMNSKLFLFSLEHIGNENSHTEFESEDSR